MKISFVSNLLCAVALTVSLTSFAGDKKKEKSGKESAGTANFDAAMYKIINTNSVRLLVDKDAGEMLRVTLKDSHGKIYYSNKFDGRNPENNRVFSLVFDLDGLKDGTYYFELSQKANKVVKTVDIASSSSRLISLK